MLENRNEIYALSVSISNILVCQHSVPELAVFASFFSSLASNISVAIQTENLKRVCALREAAQNQGQIQEPDQDDDNTILLHTENPLFVDEEQL